MSVPRRSDFYEKYGQNQSKESSQLGLKFFRSLVAQTDRCQVKLKELNSGNHGKIVKIGDLNIVLKLPIRVDVMTVAQEYELLIRVGRCSQGLALVHVPAAYAYYNSQKQFKEVSEDIAAPCMAMEQLPPPDPKLQARLQAGAYRFHYLQHARHTKHVHWRLYLGTSSLAPPKLFFREPAVVAQQAETLGLDLGKVSEEMGLFLGRIIFGLDLAPHGIEFLLTGTPAGTPAGWQVYSVDFGGFLPHNGNAREVAISIYNNADPYIPKLTKKYGHRLATGLRTAAEENNRTDFVNEILHQMEQIAAVNARSTFLQHAGSQNDWQ